MAAPKTLSQVFFNHLTKLSIQGNRRPCGKLEKTPRMQLYVSFNPADSTTVAAAITAMENSIRDVRVSCIDEKKKNLTKRLKESMLLPSLTGKHRTGAVYINDRSAKVFFVLNRGLSSNMPLLFRRNFTLLN